MCFPFAAISDKELEYACWKLDEWCGSNDCRAVFQNTLYINVETLHWELRKHQHQKRRQKFQAIFSPGFLQGFIIQFLCLKARISHYFVGSGRLYTRPLSDGGLTHSLQGSFSCGAIASPEIRQEKLSEGRPNRWLIAKRRHYLSLRTLGNPAWWWLLFLLSEQLWCDSVYTPWLL